MAGILVRTRLADGAGVPLGRAATLIWGGAAMQADDGAPGAGQRVKRRDFLAGVGLTTLAAPLLARAAFAQHAPSAPPADPTITTALWSGRRAARASLAALDGDP